MAENRARKILSAGGIGVLPTDTIYGLVGSALKPEMVRRIYKLRKRNRKKPMIILIGSLDDLAMFGIKVGPGLKKVLSKFWSGKVSVILPCCAKKFLYLHRGTKALAFRMPKVIWLRRLLKDTGPLVAPSANLEGLPPAKTIAEAKEYFGSTADFYVDRGKLESAPSTLVEITKKRGSYCVLLKRKGAVKISRQLLSGN